MDHWLEGIVDSVWLLPALFALVVGDAFLVVLPSETAVVALGALSAASGRPDLAALIAVASAGAIVGDSCCYLIGRTIGHDRWRWQREGRLAAALTRARATVLSRPASLIFTARYIPFARIAVNLSAGASELPYRRFLPLSAAAGLGWALYNVLVGSAFGTLLSRTPVLAIVVSVLVALTLGIAIDLVTTRIAAKRSATTPPAP